MKPSLLLKKANGMFVFYAPELGNYPSNIFCMNLIRNDYFMKALGF